MLNDQESAQPHLPCDTSCYAALTNHRISKVREYIVCNEATLLLGNSQDIIL